MTTRVIQLYAITKRPSPRRALTYLATVAAVVLTATAADGTSVGSMPSPQADMAPSAPEASFGPRTHDTMTALMAVAPGLGEAMSPLAATGPIQLAALSQSRPSGLPWRSGSSCSEKGLGTWRGRPLDVQTAFVQHNTWKAMLNHLGGSLSRSRHRQTPQPVISLAMLPKDATKQFARCRSGAFDGHFREFGRLLREGGAPNAAIRLGWEWNRGRSWYVETKASIPDYKACFQRQAKMLKEAAPGLSIEWTAGRRSYIPFSPLEAYPGDQAVDIIGLHYYDSFSPKIRNQAQWDTYSAAKHEGGPQGIGEWLKFAKSRGKKLAISEWGLTDWSGTAKAKADNPFYIEKMYQFFRANAADLAYENYFSCQEKHELYPSTQYPLARAKYKQLWSAGR